MDTNNNDDDKRRGVNPFFELLDMIFSQRNSELQEEVEVEKDFGPKEVGDRVKMVSDYVFHYLVDVETKEQLATERQRLPDSILKLYGSQPMLVTHVNVPENEGVFLCGHCSNLHSHDTIVFVPAVNRSYYTSLIDITVI